MKWLIFSAAVALSACSPASTPASTGPPAPSGTTDGAERLVADLVAGGVTAKLGSNFLAQPLPGEGVAVCIGTETVQVYVLKDHEAALAAASKIDPDDPSKIGTSIVDWSGRPRFWLRDRIVVLYLGDNAGTDAALRNVLGQPFAEATVPGRPPLPAPDCA